MNKFDVNKYDVGEIVFRTNGLSFEEIKKRTKLFKMDTLNNISRTLSDLQGYFQRVNIIAREIEATSERGTDGKVKATKKLNKELTNNLTALIDRMMDTVNAVLVLLCSQGEAIACIMKSVAAFGDDVRNNEESAKIVAFLYNKIASNCVSIIDVTKDIIDEEEESPSGLRFPNLIVVPELYDGGKLIESVDETDGQRKLMIDAVKLIECFHISCSVLCVKRDVEMAIDVINTYATMKEQKDRRNHLNDFCKEVTG